MDLEPIDMHPERRVAQIEAARRVLGAAQPVDPATLRHACTVLLTLSPDPGLRLMAREVLHQLGDEGGA